MKLFPSTHCVLCLVNWRNDQSPNLTQFPLTLCIIIPYAFIFFRSLRPGRPWRARRMDAFFQARRGGRHTFTITSLVCKASWSGWGGRDVEFHCPPVTCGTKEPEQPCHPTKAWRTSHMLTRVPRSHVIGCVSLDSFRDRLH